MLTKKLAVIIIGLMVTLTGMTACQKNEAEMETEAYVVDNYGKVHFKKSYLDSVSKNGDFMKLTFDEQGALIEEVKDNFDLDCEERIVDMAK